MSVREESGGLKGLSLGRVARVVALLVLAVVVLFPVYYTVVGSVMGPGDIASAPPSLFPHSLTLSNYRGVFHAIPLGRQYLNSTLVAVVITLAQIFCAVLSAYAFVFMALPFKRAFFALFLLTLMVPWEAIIIPNFLFMADHQLRNNYLALMLPFLAGGFGTFLLRQAFLSFPVELRDAATLDGAGHFRFLFRILLPLSRPAMASVGIFVFLSAWNQFFWPLLITDSPNMQTLQIGLASLNDAEQANPGLILAGVSMALIPTALLVAFGQRFLIRGLTAGAVR
ncbi:carbohydrate ABC transporter permease [Jatrophihabitans lederbergiae]|uniref:Carbohydrate ABC transporter permease n=1 Tax=Jatrophihabitans lederbergiae TaxID=3075547 RepID=A0ABU2JDH2_9ACTN|nr:carbohydrate ABC transporter permease [Jatrophihabitans sp. DSM 44399]MDT0262821.1 carbohydrate ABC transporter permease [Jatrophihabitans sp. DSM 44399]